jgi:phi13 family phage major tail protein
MSVAEQKSAVGLRDLYVAEVTEDSVSAYVADTPALLAPAVNVSQSVSVNSKPDYADDGIFDMLTSEGETKLEMEVTAFAPAMLAFILGKLFDAVNGQVQDNAAGTPPDVALSFRSVKSNGKYRYRQYLKGKFSPGNEENATKTDTPEPKHAKVTFTAYKTIHQFAMAGGVTDGCKKVDVDEDTAGASVGSFFSAVQVPVVGTPSAVTCTPSPTDGAVGQATTVAITLTFNNAMAGNAEVGVSLTRVDTGAVTAITATWNAARTVLTLAHSALTAATQYFITVAGARDIYGQLLTTAVYDFTVA